MSILEADKIDIIAVKGDSDVVNLIIADHLEWEDESHYSMIQDKVNYYINFIESNGLSSLPNLKIPVKPKITISMALKHKPTIEAALFLGKVKNFLTSIDIDFIVDFHVERHIN